jgi:hypothetical protein
MPVGRDERVGWDEQVGPDQPFCGEYCRDHASDASHEEHVCECGHRECTMAGMT